MGESFYKNMFYNTDPEKPDYFKDNADECKLTFTFNTVNQSSSINKDISNREYDFRFAVPR
jgi:hypothetical protein